jgi:hypothetical protein
MVFFEYVEQRVVFTFHKGRIHRNVAGGHTERGFHFIGSDFQQFGQFLRTGFALESLFQF